MVAGELVKSFLKVLRHIHDKILEPFLHYFSEESPALFQICLGTLRVMRILSILLLMSLILGSSYMTMICLLPFSSGCSGISF